MAPVPLEPSIRWSSVALVVGHLLTSGLSSAAVGTSLYRSFKALGPAQDTRDRRAQRSHLIPVFAALAVVSLGAAVFTTAHHTVLSYSIWAKQRDIAVPLSIHSNGTAAAHLTARWLSDTPIFLDAVEILAEKARRFWWAQQVELGLVSWNLLLAIEGRRRNIPFLWCYSLLGQCVSLSYGQNLFFLALLLTPSPLPPRADGLPGSWYVRLRDSIFRQKPTNWTLHPAFNLAVLISQLAIQVATPLFVATPVLVPLVVTSRLLLLAPLAFPYLASESWGTVHAHPHQAYRKHASLFQLVSFGSFALHGKATAVGLAFNAPNAHHHRHMIPIPFDVEETPAWEQTTTAFGRILRATSDHPVVRGVGLDVMLSALSLGLWTAVRATDLQDILTSIVPFYNRAGDKGQKKLEDSSPATRSKTTGSAAASQAEDTAGRYSTRRKSRRSGKSKPDPEGPDAAYEPTTSEAASLVEGDVVPEAGNLDWETAAAIWGLVVVGGLGVGSAGALGGECIAR